MGFFLEELLEQPTETFQCVGCSVPVVKEYRSPPKKYCSKKCRDKKHNNSIYSSKYYFENKEKFLKHNWKWRVRDAVKKNPSIGLKWLYELEQNGDGEE